MKLICSVAIFMCIFVAAQCGTPTINGPCPDFKPMENVDGTKVAGNWFTLAEGKVGLEGEKGKPEEQCKCGKKNIVQTPTGYNGTFTYMDGENKQKTKKTVATKKPGNKAIFSVECDDVPKSKGLTFTLSVVDTDYDHKLLACMCISDGTKHGYKTAVFGRDKAQPPAVEWEKIKEKLKLHGVTHELKNVDQSC